MVCLFGLLSCLYFLSGSLAFSLAVERGCVASDLGTSQDETCSPPVLCKTVPRVAAPAQGKLPEVGWRGGDRFFAAQHQGSGLQENLFKQRNEREQGKCLPSRPQKSLETRTLKVQTISELENKSGLRTLKIHSQSRDFFYEDLPDSCFLSPSSWWNGWFTFRFVLTAADTSNTITKAGRLLLHVRRQRGWVCLKVMQSRVTADLLASVRSSAWGGETPPCPPARPA